VIDKWATRKLGQDTQNQLCCQYYSKSTETLFLPPVTLYRVITNAIKQDLTGGGRYQTKKQRNFRIYASDLDQAMCVAGLNFYPKTGDVIVTPWRGQYVVANDVDLELHYEEFVLYCQQAEGPVQLNLVTTPPVGSTWDQITSPVWNLWIENWGS
jgi:hypothetical protein